MDNLIEVEQITRKFGNFTAVDGLTFEVRRNEIFGLLGPNGAGKTTTINMICGLLPPTSGSIRFNCSNGGNQKSNIGYCAQENILYPKLTCLEQLQFIGNMYGLNNRTSNEKALMLLSMLGLREKTNSLASSLSGGMKRRLNICMALIHDPQILILDEPEAGLDPQSRILVRDFIRLTGKERTVILTTHNMDEADRLADRIAIMDYGKLLLLDTPENLKMTIGEGDVLEIISPDENENGIACLAAKSATIVDVVSHDARHIILRHRNIIQLLSGIKDLSEQCNVIIGEIKLRENTLEDVFIHLTGRNLRQ
jgi:ABC-2 type transport system ATP-binding protein